LAQTDDTDPDRLAKSLFEHGGACREARSRPPSDHLPGRVL